MSRLDAVVRVLKSTGRPLHYDVITRQALQLVRKKKKLLLRNFFALFICARLEEYMLRRVVLDQGIIRFTGSQGTAGESMKVLAPRCTPKPPLPPPTDRDTPEASACRH